MLNKIVIHDMKKHQKENIVKNWLKLFLAAYILEKKYHIMKLRECSKN